MPSNRLYYGDNLDVLRTSVADESVDLVYLDPPFNSNANYNVLFKSPTGNQSQAQIEAFDDTWTCGPRSQEAMLDMLVLDAVFGAERLTGALLDRLTHHVHILEMNGESYRLKTSRRRRAGKPEQQQSQRHQLR